MQKMIWKHAKFYPLFTTTQPNSNFCAFGEHVGAVHSDQQTIKTRWRFAPWGRLKGGDAAVIETIRTTRRANNSSGRQNVVDCDRRVTPVDRAASTPLCWTEHPPSLCRRGSQGDWLTWALGTPNHYSGGGFANLTRH